MRLILLLVAMSIALPAQANQGVRNYLAQAELVSKGASLAMICEGYYASGITKKCSYEQQKDFEVACNLLWPYVDEYLTMTRHNRRHAEQFLKNLKRHYRISGRNHIRNGKWRQECKDIKELRKTVEEKF